MNLTKEEYENLINGSPLFTINKECEHALYKTHYYKLINSLIEYCTGYIYTLRQRKGGTLSAAGYNSSVNEYNAIIFETAMETAVECIKNYDKEKGQFLNLFNYLMKRNLAKARAKEVEDKRRGGIKLTKDEEVLISKISKFVKCKGVNIGSPDIQAKIAKTLHRNPEEVAELIRINEDAVAVSSTVKNEDGDEIEIFDLKQSKEASAEKDIEQLSQVEYQLKNIEEEFNCLQNRPQQRKLLSMLLTAKFVKEFDGEKRYLALVKRMAFYSKEIDEIYLTERRIPLDLEIADICSVSPQQASNTFKNFLKKIK